MHTSHVQYSAQTLEITDLTNTVCYMFASVLGHCNLAAEILENAIQIWTKERKKESNEHFRISITVWPVWNVYFEFDEGKPKVTCAFNAFAQQLISLNPQIWKQLATTNKGNIEILPTNSSTLPFCYSIITYVLVTHGAGNVGIMIITTTIMMIKIENLH